MGRTDEQPESAGGGDHSERAGVQLTEAQNEPVQESVVEVEQPETIDRRKTIWQERTECCWLMDRQRLPAAKITSEQGSS